MKQAINQYSISYLANWNLPVSNALFPFRSFFSKLWSMILLACISFECAILYEWVLYRTSCWRRTSIMHAHTYTHARTMVHHQLLINLCSHFQISINFIPFFFPLIPFHSSILVQKKKHIGQWTLIVLAGMLGTFIDAIII